MGQIKISPDMTFKSLSKLWFKDIEGTKSNASKKRIKYKKGRLYKKLQNLLLNARVFCSTPPQKPFSAKTTVKFNR